MKFGIYIFLTISFLCSGSTLRAQDFEIEQWFKGELIDSKTKEPIELGVIVNMRQSKASSINQGGAFYIKGRVGDTLKFRCIGYENETWIIPGYWTHKGTTIQLQVSPKVYSLKSVDVIHYYSYAHFRQAFKNLKLPEEEEIDLALNLEKEIKEALAYKKASEGKVSVSLGMAYKSKVQREKEKVARLEKQELKNEHLYALTSHENLKDFTGYDGLCLDSFVVFLRTHYVLKAEMDDYFLMSVVKSASDRFYLENKNNEWFTCAGEQVM